MKRILLAAALAASACARSAPKDPAEYRPSDGSFTAHLPGNWKVDDAPGLTRKAAFFGPPDGPRPFADMIRVSLQPGMSPEAYRASRTALGTPSHEITVNGLKALEFTEQNEFRDPHAGVQKRTARVIMIPAASGLFVLEYVRPSGAVGGEEPFEELLRTFKPGV